MYSSHIQKMTWVQEDEATPRLCVPILKDTKLIILQTGGMGFILWTLTIWKSSQLIDNYHKEINFNNYFK